MKSLTTAQSKRVQHLRKTGIIISEDLNNNGFLNIVQQKKNSKVAEFIFWCFGPKGGIHKHIGYRNFDFDTNQPFDKVYTAVE